jgi:hypothetical protein
MIDDWRTGAILWRDRALMRAYNARGAVAAASAAIGASFVHLYPKLYVPGVLIAVAVVFHRVYRIDQMERRWRATDAKHDGEVP